MNASGANGPFYANGESCLTGLMIRKYLNPSASAEIGEGKSEQHFLLMRYAEVLLNMAEAAVEMSMAGVSAPDGADLLQEATNAVNDIRRRAGANLLTTTLPNTDDGRDIVRRERRKELAFESKTKWDLRRWRVQHYEGRDGFWGVRNAIKQLIVTPAVIASVAFILSTRHRPRNGSLMCISSLSAKKRSIIRCLIITGIFLMARLPRALLSISNLTVKVCAYTLQK